MGEYPPRQRFFLLKASSGKALLSPLPHSHEHAAPSWKKGSPRLYACSDRQQQQNYLETGAGLDRRHPAQAEPPKHGTLGKFWDLLDYTPTDP